MYGCLRKKHNPAKQPCRQDAGRADCFALNKIGNCNVLTETEYPCGECPFYKPQEVFDNECMEAYDRLEALGRNDLIAKYQLRDRGLIGCWTVKIVHRRTGRIQL